MQTFKFGTAVRDISPEYPIWLNGYGSRSKKSTDISEPLSVAALALSDGNTTVMFITMDLVGLTTQTLQEYYELLEKEVGIGFPSLMFCCSHTHFAPVPHASIPMWASLGIIETDVRFAEGARLDGGLGYHHDRYHLHVKPADRGSLHPASQGPGRRRGVRLTAAELYGQLDRGLRTDLCRGAGEKGGCRQG